MSSFIGKKQDIILPICNKCKNHIDGLKCKAFDIIPDSIINGGGHSKPIYGQENDTVFERI